MVTVQALKAHIAKLNSVGITFNPEMDSRADLVRFHNYSIEEAASLPEFEVYSILDGVDVSSNSHHFETECKCSKCGSFLIETAYSDHDDCYTLHCKICKTDLRIHYTSYDAWRDEIADAKQFESEACDVVKLLSKYCSVCVDNSKSLKETVRSNGKHIQTIELEYETAEYYMMDGRYYKIGVNSGEMKPRTETDFIAFLEGMSKLV